MSRGTLKCVLVLVIHVFATRAQWAIEDEGCRTPDKKVGTCIEVYNCKPMMDVLEAAPQPIPRQVTETLRRYQCGFSGRNPKVCCPQTPIVVPGITVQIREVEVPPPDVSNHRNLRLLPRNCGVMESSDKITHGNKTGVFEFPWMALLSYRTSRGPQFKCGASIINDRYLLTAAHCITNLQSPLIGVRVGEHNINTRPDCELNGDGDRICAPAYQDLAIEEILPHPEFDTKVFTHDIGLLRIANSMDLTRENVKPVCMPLERARNYNFTSRNCLVTGWGVTETGRMSAELLKVQIPTLSNEECAEIYKNETKITFRQLCAGGRTRSDSCAGDSGGPLHVPTFVHGDTRMVQQGIVSFGPRICGREGYPGVYTRVAHYMNWILDSMKA